MSPSSYFGSSPAKPDQPKEATLGDVIGDDTGLLYYKKNNRKYFKENVGNNNEVFYGLNGKTITFNGYTKDRLYRDRATDGTVLIKENRGDTGVDKSNILSSEKKKRKRKKKKEGE